MYNRQCFAFLAADHWMINIVLAAEWIDWISQLLLVRLLLLRRAYLHTTASTVTGYMGKRLSWRPIYSTKQTCYSVRRRPTWYTAQVKLWQLRKKIPRTCRRPMVTMARLFILNSTGRRRWIIHGRADYLIACIPAVVVPVSPPSCWGWPVCCLPCWPWPPKRTASPLYPSPSAGTWFDSISISNRRGITTTAGGLDPKLPAASTTCPSLFYMHATFRYAADILVWFSPSKVITVTWMLLCVGYKSSQSTWTDGNLFGALVHTSTALK